MSVHTFSMRLPATCPDPSAVALHAMRATVEASGHRVRNLDSLVPDITLAGEVFSISIGNISIEHDPEFDKPCGFCA